MQCIASVPTSRSLHSMHTSTADITVTAYLLCRHHSHPLEVRLRVEACVVPGPEGHHPHVAADPLGPRVHSQPIAQRQHRCQLGDGRGGVAGPAAPEVVVARDEEDVEEGRGEEGEGVGEDLRGGGVEG